MEEVFNFNVVKDLLMGDEESAKDLLKNYIKQTEKNIVLLSSLFSDALFEEKREELKSKAHLLKGSSLNISGKDFAQVMLQIEKGALSLPRNEIEELYALGIDKWNVLKNEIEKVL